MKPTAAVQVTTMGDFGPDTTSVKMGIDESNFEHIMMLLTDLYSDQILAVIREYSTNARDSHKEAGITRPIEVTLPNLMSPFFKVRDYGVGLSADEVVNIYSKYGSSTKRESNDFNGMLGLGCKSALTYTNQFTVVSVKDGEKITVVIARSGNVPTLEIVDKQAGVNEPNGVEVQVPVKPNDARSFEQKARHIYSFWADDSVLLNGKKPDAINLKYVTSTIGTTTDIGHDVVVMGGVPYPVQRKLFTGNRPYPQFDVVAFVNIGEVAFTPSREALMYTKHTESTVEGIRKTFESTITESIVKDINSKATHAEAYRSAVDWQSKFPSVMPKPVSYNGVEIPNVLEFGYAKWDTASYRQAYGSGYDKISLANLVKSLVIYDFPGIQLSSTYKAKIKQYKATNNISASYHVLTVAKEGAPWVPESRMVSWASIKAEVLPGQGGSGQPRKKPSIDIYSRVDGYSSSQPLDDTLIPVYVSPTSRLGSSNAKTLYTQFPDIQIVSLGENRWDKFKRENPKAENLKAFLRTRLTEARDALTPRDIKVLTVDHYQGRKVEYLDPALIDDPTLRDYTEVVQEKGTSAAVQKFTALQNLCMRYQISSPDFPPNTIGSILSEYPLLTSVERGTLAEKHTYVYLNAAFAANV